LLLVGLVGRLRFRWHQRGRQRGTVHVFTCRQRRRRFDRVDSYDRASEPDFVRTNPPREVGQRRLCAKLAAKFLSRRFKLSALTANAARPGISAKRVNHRAANSALGKGLELDAAIFIEPARGVDETDHAVLNQIPQLNRVGHGRGNAARQRFHERETCGDALSMTGGEGLTLHLILSSKDFRLPWTAFPYLSGEWVARQLEYQDKTDQKAKPK